MSKPSKPVLLDHRTKNLVLTEVLEAEGAYQVCFQGRPIALRTSSQSSAFKYPKTCFPQQAHAIRLAAKLNVQFNTTDFAVREIL